ncbi:hypothetical protein JTE90_017748 [Oedothorax gibbosus]|uniref:Uncharacterized protein n=1 Tax=Oedothorax gibbosus TaxID=931172 RepID=A0AAV6TJ54_9ARAC|nr:hypothetical protein JTE90_017748 [Oedothorax gibbosus]
MDLPSTRPNSAMDLSISDSSVSLPSTISISSGSFPTSGSQSSLNSMDFWSIADSPLSTSSSEHVFEHFRTLRLNLTQISVSHPLSRAATLCRSLHHQTLYGNPAHRPPYFLLSLQHPQIQPITEPPYLLISPKHPRLQPITKDLLPSYVPSNRTSVVPALAAAPTTPVQGSKKKPSWE